MTHHASTGRDTYGTLERTADGGIIKFERHLSYPIDDVWDAITNPERLRDWWLPFDAEITVDLIEGGLMEMRATGDEPMTIVCTILQVKPPILLEHTHVDPGSIMRWELEPVGDACILRLSHHVPDPDLAIDNCYLVGLHTSLDRLAPALRHEPIEWDWARFAEYQTRYAEHGLARPVTEAEEPAN